MFAANPEFHRIHEEECGRGNLRSDVFGARGAPGMLPLPRGIPQAVHQQRVTVLELHEAQVPVEAKDNVGRLAASGGELLASGGHARPGHAKSGRRIDRRESIGCKVTIMNILLQ